MEHLVCTGCGRLFDVGASLVRCPDCAEPLELGPPGADSPAAGTRAHKSAGGGHGRWDEAEGALLARYAAFLPAAALGLGPGREAPLTLGEGNTPLLPLARLGERVGLLSLFAKVEGANPTGSFKDRGTVAGVQRARHAGYGRVGTVSTGNMAGSVAAYAAAAGMEAVVLVPAHIPRAKLAPIAAYGPRLIAVEGDYGRLYDLTVALAHRGPADGGMAFINSDDPWRVEGQKTLALELWRQNRGVAPDVIIVPVSSGGNMAALLKGFRELHALGFIPRLPRLIGVQAAGCAPIATAYARGHRRPVPWDEPRTVARAIANATPPSGRRLLRAAAAGAPLEFVTVTDEQLLQAYDELAAQAGIFVQPDGAAPWAAAKKLAAAGRFARDETVVIVLTGHGTKDLTPLAAKGRAEPEVCPLDELPRRLAL